MKNLTGQRFACLTVTGFSHRERNSVGVWFCECDCGKKTVAWGNKLVQGSTKSCGHLRRERLRSIKTRAHNLIMGEHESGLSLDDGLEELGNMV